MESRHGVQSSGADRQSNLFVDESERFVRTHLTEYPAAPSWVLDSATLSELPPTSILDVGCGPGYFLSSLVEHFGAESGIGVEPSPVAVDLLEDHWAGDKRVRFASGQAHRLPFETDSFDLVVCWSVLHWVGRNEYLQAIGELVRVTRRHLLIMDFVAAEPYRVRYRHDPRLFTYKCDFEVPVLASGVMRVAESGRWWDAERPGTVEYLTEADLEPFVGNKLSYHARKACLFVKDYQSLPELSESDFL